MWSSCRTFFPFFCTRRIDEHDSNPSFRAREGRAHRGKRMVTSRMSRQESQVQAHIKNTLTLTATAVNRS